MFGQASEVAYVGEQHAGGAGGAEQQAVLTPHDLVDHFLRQKPPHRPLEALFAAEIFDHHQHTGRNGIGRIAFERHNRQVDRAHTPIGDRQIVIEQKLGFAAAQHRVDFFDQHGVGAGHERPRIAAGEPGFVEAEDGFGSAVDLGDTPRRIDRDHPAGHRAHDVLVEIAFGDQFGK